MALANARFAAWTWLRWHHRVQVGYGDTYSPRLDLSEPLKAECQSFVDAVRDEQRPLTDGQNGLDVVRIIEAANQSLLNGNERVAIVK